MSKTRRLYRMEDDSHFYVPVHDSLKTQRTIRRRQTLPAIRHVEADAWIAIAGMKTG